MSPAPPYILLDDQITPNVRLYQNPIEIIRIDNPDDISDGFARLQIHHEAGRYIAGYMSYELGYALEQKLDVLMPSARPVPLMLWGVFETVELTSADLFKAPPPTPKIRLKPDWTFAQYRQRFNKARDYLIAGDVYQINLTFPMRAECDADGFDLYSKLRHRQPGKYGGVVNLDGPEIITFSPELFFRKLGDDVSMRPMKGTIKRGPDALSDESAAQSMKADAKSQAENLMIVDLLRNDLSRISRPGSVKVPELYALETYPTLHQMTSVVHAELKPNLDFESMVRGLFPSGSITGAPKVRAMEIINELEPAPRGVYCGSVGYIDPDGHACFNVAIRTLTLESGKLSYKVGSGVVLDSVAENEYAECLLKAKVLDAKPELIETLRWDAEVGFVRRNQHLDRMEKSAQDLGYLFYRGDAIKALILAKGNLLTHLRLRLTLNDLGEFTAEAEPLNTFTQPLKIALSKNPLSSHAQILDHKTSERDFYDGERVRLQGLTGCDEVLFFNKNDELCEGSFTSVFIEKNGQLLTPALSCGLLPGILRHSMLETGQAKEAILTLKDLETADRIFVGNSLRELLPAKLLSLKLR